MHQLTRAALKYRISDLQDLLTFTDDDPAIIHDYRNAEKDCQLALTEDSLVNHKTAWEELNYYLVLDLPRKEWLAINRDLALAGALTKYNPKAYYSRKPQLITVKGVKYEAW